MDPLDGEVLVAELDGRPIGLVGWHEGGQFSNPDEAEVRVLLVEPDARRRGAATALLAGAEARMAGAGVRAAWLVSTNDNIEALAFYGHRGWLVSAILAGAVDEARRTLKPGIPAIAENGIPIRDELVLRRSLSRLATAPKGA